MPVYIYTYTYIYIYSSIVARSYRKNKYRILHARKNDVAATVRAELFIFLCLVIYCSNELITEANGHLHPAVWSAANPQGFFFFKAVFSVIALRLYYVFEFF